MTRSRRHLRLAGNTVDPNCDLLVCHERAVERLRFISAAKRLDLSLDSIRDLQQAWDVESSPIGEGTTPMVAARVAEADEGIAALTELARGLQAGLQRLEAWPDRDHPGDHSCAFRDDPATDAEANLATGTEPMEAQPTEPALVACSLTGQDQRDRLSQWHDLLEGARIDHTADGAVPCTSIPFAAAALLSREALPLRVWRTRGWLHA